LLRFAFWGFAGFVWLAGARAAEGNVKAPAGESPPAAPAAATPAPTGESDAALLRPTGPVTVTADRAEWEKGGAMVYTGNVRLASDNLQLSGDRLELRQFEDRQFEAKVSGAPAVLQHAGVSVEQGEPALPVEARAALLTYDSRSSTVEVSGKARLQRGTDEITGENIRYDVARRRIQASGSNGGQVRIVIQPPPPEAKPDPGAKPRALPKEAR
jgi:lipopolysaccharide export system protein LptA